MFTFLKLIKNKVSLIRSRGLEFSLSLTFSCKEKWVIDTKREFTENVYSFEYSSNLHSTNSTFQLSDDEDNDYQTITLETEVVEEEIDERLQIGLEIGKNLDMPIVTDDE